MEELQGTDAHQERGVDMEDAEELRGGTYYHQELRAKAEPESPQESDGHLEPGADMEQRPSEQSGGYRDPNALQGVDAFLEQFLHERMVEAVSACRIVLRPVLQDEAAGTCWLELAVVPGTLLEIRRSCPKTY